MGRGRARDYTPDWTWAWGRRRPSRAVPVLPPRPTTTEQCRYCQAAISRHNMARHVKFVHTPAGRYSSVCQCGNVSYRPDTTRRHRDRCPWAEVGPFKFDGARAPILAVGHSEINEALGPTRYTVDDAGAPAAVGHSEATQGPCKISADGPTAAEGRSDKVDASGLAETDVAGQFENAMELDDLRMENEVTVEPPPIWPQQQITTTAPPAKMEMEMERETHDASTQTTEEGRYRIDFYFHGLACGQGPAVIATTLEPARALAAGPSGNCPAETAGIALDNLLGEADILQQAADAAELNLRPPV